MNVGTGTGTWSFYEWEYISILLFRDLEFLGTGVHFIFAVQGQGPGVFRNGSHFSLLFRNRDLEFSTKLVQEALAVPEDDGIIEHLIIIYFGLRAKIDVKIYTTERWWLKSAKNHLNWQPVALNCNYRDY